MRSRSCGGRNNKCSFSTSCLCPIWRSKFHPMLLKIMIAPLMMSVVVLSFMEPRLSATMEFGSNWVNHIN